MDDKLKNFHKKEVRKVDDFAMKKMRTDVVFFVRGVWLKVLQRASTSGRYWMSLCHILSTFCCSQLIRRELEEFVIVFAVRFVALLTYLESFGSGS